MEAWYVAKTKPGKERWVEACLRDNMGLEVFSPFIRRPAGRRGGWEPLFPTYLFCHVDPCSADWPSIRWAPGLCYFLGINQQLVPLPDEVVARLRQQVARWNDEGFVPRFAPGERVAIVNGPFAGLDAIFRAYVPARQRCQVLLQVVGRLTTVELPAEALAGLSPYRALAAAT